jgi:penicillin-binding protein
MGKEVFLEGMKTFAVGQEDPLGFGFEASQIAKEGIIGSDILLADSGYGQGQVLFNALTLPKAYTALAQDGKMKNLKLFLDEEPPVEVQVITSETAGKILALMKETVDNPQGTAHGGYLEGRSLAGKTGTSEIGQGRNRTELGWYSVIDEDSSRPYITTMMIENVQGRGGSSLTVEKVRAFITGYGLE